MGFSLKNVDKSAINKFAPSDAYGHKDTNELVKNDEIAKAIFDNALEQAKELAKDYVLKANNGVAFTDTKKDSKGAVSEYTPKIVVKVEPRKVQDTEYVMGTDEKGYPKVKENPDGTPMTKPKTEMKNGKEVPVMRPVKLEELDENQQNNKGNLYSVMMSYTLKGQQVQIFASAKVNEENGKPKADVKFVTPIVSQYSQNKAECRRVKGIDDIKAEIEKPNTWIKPEIKQVVSKMFESGVIAEKTSAQTYEYAKSLNEKFENGLKVEIPKRERDNDGKVIYDDVNGKKQPRIVEGETEQVPMCSARTFKNSSAEGVQIYNRKDTNIVVELGSYKGTDGSDKQYTKVTDWNLTYPLGADGKPDRDAEPIDREPNSSQIPASQVFNSAEGIILCTPPIPELHEALCERLNVSQEEYAQIFVQAYEVEPNGANGFGDGNYSDNDNEEVEKPTASNEQKDEEQKVNPEEFEEISLSDDDMPF